MRYECQSFLARFFVLYFAHHDDGDENVGVDVHAVKRVTVVLLLSVMQHGGYGKIATRVTQASTMRKNIKLQEL